MTIRIDGTNTTANPGITGGDADTGLQFGTDEVKIVTGGSDRVTVDSSGNVGIGTTSPFRSLEISATNAQMALKSANTGYSELYFSDTDSNSISAIGYDHNTNNLYLNVNGAERARIDSSGNLSITAGNLVLASGSGIDFSATADGSGTVTSELLDDYEEGTWTPVNGSGTGVFDSATWGRYTKIGRSVFISCYVGIDSMDDTTNTFTVGGVPFTPVDPGTGGFAGSVMSKEITFGAGSPTQLVAYITDTTNGIRFYGCGNNIDWEVVQNLHVNIGDAMYVNIMFKV